MTVPALPDEPARALYLALLAKGGLFHPQDLPVGDAAALRRLRETGLVVQQQGQALWTVVDPRLAGGRLGAQLRSAGLELLARADEQPELLGELTDAYDRAPRLAAGRSVIQHVDDQAQIQQRVEQLVLASSWEILAAHPGGAREFPDLPQAKESARELHRRGVSTRVLYQPGARRDARTIEYAAYVTALSTRVRVLDEPFLRLMVFDRETAVISSAHDNFLAAFVEDPVVVGLVVDQFERDWARAERVRWDGSPPDPLVALLARGLTQRAIATRLGLSERTVAERISRLREEYDVQTLFQLGWQIGGERPGS
jgi:sugar-specific transcriptional regulator TrmB